MGTLREAVKLEHREAERSKRGEANEQGRGRQATKRVTEYRAEADELRRELVDAEAARYMTPLPHANLISTDLSALSVILGGSDLRTQACALLHREAEAALRKGAAREAEALRASSEHLRTSLEAEQLARRSSEKELGASQTRWDKTSAVLDPQTAGRLNCRRV